MASYAWTFAEGTLPDPAVSLSDSTAAITGTHVYAAPGDFLAILAVADSMSTVRDTVVVSVKPRDVGPPLEADAGENATAATDSLVLLQGKAKGGSGTIAGYAWKFGDEAFSPATPSGDTSVTLPSQPGSFTVVLKVTDTQDRSDLDTVVFTVVASANANLAALKLGGADLDPVFKPATELYTASVPFGITRINVGAVPQHQAATVKAGARYLGPSDSAEVVLSVGENIFEAVVLSQSGAQKKYQVTVTRRKNTETRLAGLELSVGSLSPKFHPDTLEYTVGVGNEVAAVTLKAVASDSVGATLRLAAEGADTVPLAPGTPSAAQTLEVGTRAFQVWVIAQDGEARRAYRVAVTRRASPNATLLSLEPSAGTLKPAFGPNISEYFDTVPHAQATLLLRAVPTSDKAKLFQAGAETASGADGPLASLPVGDTTLSLLVRAETGDTNTYRVRVHRKSDDASLKSLTTSVSGLPKGFVPGTLSYADTVGAEVTSLTVTPVPNHPQAKAEAASPVTLADGANPIAVTVTAEDGNTRAYTLNVYRISGNARLTSVEASAGDWAALFKPEVLSYKDTVPESVARVAIRATVASGKSQIKIQGKLTASGVWSDSVTLAEGTQTLKVTVFAESGDSAEYALSLYRTSANAQLQSLSISPGSLSPAFSPQDLVYTDTLDWQNETPFLIGTLANNKSIIVKIGSRTVSLKSINEQISVREGPDTLDITVQAEDGSTQTYQMRLTRKFHPASLSTLTLNRGVLDSTFERNRLVYKSTFTYGQTTFSPTGVCTYSDCTVKLGMFNFTSRFNMVPLITPPGDSAFDIIVTGAGGLTRTYTLKTSRPRGFTQNFASGKNFKTGIRTPDGGYAVLGELRNGSRLEDHYMIKTNSAGDSLWSKAYGTPASDWVTTMKPTLDNGLVVLGNAWPSGQILVTRTDAAHDPIWTKTLPLNTIDRESQWDVVATSDGGFVVIADLDGFSPDLDSVLLQKLSSDGDLVWRKSYDPSMYTRGARLKSIHESADGSLIISGATQIDTGCEYGMLLKTNAAGDVQWMKTYPNADPGTYDILNSVAPTSDGGFILAGSRGGGSNTGYLVRTDADGKEIWFKDFGIGSWSHFNSAKQTNDGGFIAVGGCTAATGGGDIYVVKVDASGSAQWTKTFASASSDDAFTVLQTSDGGYMVFGRPPFTMLKLDKLGNSN